MNATIELTLTSILDSISTNEILYDYDASKLYLELSRSEAKAILDNQDLFIKAFNLSTDINNVSGLINGRKKSFKEIEEELLGYKSAIATFDNDLYQKYIEQWLFPVEALLMYRSGQFVKAESLTICAMEKIDDLITQHNLYSFLFRLILQNSNLSTLYFQSNHSEKAEHILRGILDYLFNGNASEYIYGLAFCNKDLWQEMEFLREYNAYYYFKSSLEKISRNKEDYFQRYQDSFERVLTPLSSMEVFTEERYLINAWIKVETNFINKDYSAFFEGVKMFFNDEVDESFNFLKIHLLDSMFIAFKKLKFTGYHSYNEEILKLRTRLGENWNLDVINTSTKIP